jgi:hypothetical protein
LHGKEFQRFLANPKGIPMNVRSSIASTVSLLVGCGAAAFAHIGTAAADDSFLQPGSLVISSSTYEGWTGAVASLQAGITPLPDTNTATIPAVSGNNYVTVWNNDTVDGSFGVTSPIYLTAVDPHSGRVLNTLRVPTGLVVTSFSSKSELALHLGHDERGSHLVFVGYASPGVGALDVSNSDAVPGQDPTNPVTFAFGSNYAFHRTIVSVDDDGHFAFTPTINYGGNNGRAVLLGSNGLYYTVGNANNGNATTFGASNDTNPDVTETTGLEAVNPLNAWSPDVIIPDGNSAEVNPLLQFGLGKKGAEDKPGKDDNFRGVTEYRGALYFTKGSGSNGVQTVYTVINPPQSMAGFVPVPNTGPAAGNVLPTVANAGQQAIAILNGFPTDSARASLADGTTGGDYTPFALFFANDHTLYVTDEGTGNSADAAHAGLEKWILGRNGTWTLAYTLTSGLIGKVDTNLIGHDGQYPNVTTIGLRNLSGVVNQDGTVTLWAATSTSSASGDNGADPNRVVEITDEVSATTLTGKVASEAFRSIVGPTYGTVYRGVAYVADHDRDHDRDHGRGW